MRYTHKLILIVVSLWTESLFAQSVATFDQPIPDNRLTQFFDYVSGVSDSFLGVNGQGVCGVKIRFSHNHLSDLKIKLVSPGGQEITFIGNPGPGYNTQGSSWNVSFVRCSGIAAPDIGLAPFWENSGNWQKNTNYSGVYFPVENNCLESFNSGPANGLWNIQILDAEALDTGKIISASIIFCNPTGGQCSACYKKSGVWKDTTINVCAGNPGLNISVRPTFPDGGNGPGTGYKYVVGNSSNKIIALLNVPDLRLFPPGKYTIYGFAYDVNHSQFLPKADSTVDLLTWVNLYKDKNPKLCGDVTLNKITVNIFPVSQIDTITKFICMGHPVHIEDSTIVTPGVYTFFLKNEFGCDSTITYNFLPVDFSLQINSDGLLSCTHKLVKLKVNSLYIPPTTKFNWFTLDGQILGPKNLDSVNVNLPAIYFLELSGLGCVDTLSFYLDKDSTLPDIFVDNIVLDCNTPQNYFHASSSSSLVYFQWIGPNGYTSDLSDPLISVPGMYEVTAFLPGGCSVSKKVEAIGNFTLPDFNIMNVIKDCEVDTAVLSITDFPSGTVFAWQFPLGNSATGNSVSSNQNGDFLITAQGLNGCTITHTARVTFEHESPLLDVWDSELNCTHPTLLPPARLEGVFDSIAIVWPDGFVSNKADTMLDIPGTYQITLSNDSKCIAVKSFTLNNDFRSPIISINPTSFRCTTDSLRIACTITPLNANIFWTGPNQFTSSQIRPWVYEYGWYYVTAVMPNGCESVDSIYIGKQFNSPSFELNSDTITCLKSNVVLKAQVSSPNSFTIRWSGPGGFTSSSNPVTVNVPGKYWVNVRGNNGCFTNRSTLVYDFTHPPKPVIFQDSISCKQDFALVAIQNDSLFKFIKFITPGSDTLVPNLPFQTALQDTFRIILEDHYGCVQDTFVHIAIDDDVPKFALDSFHLTCKKPVVKLSIKGGSNFESVRWHFPDGTDKEAVSIDTRIAGQYSVVISNKNGCQSTAYFTIPIDTVKPKLILRDSFLTCRNPILTMQYFMNAVNPKAQWKGPFSFSSKLLYPEAKDTGIYTLTITDQYGCSALDSMHIGQGSRVPELTVANDTIRCSNRQPIIRPQTNASLPIFTWTLPDSTQINSDVLYINKVGQYWVEVIDSNLCIAKDSFFIYADTIGPVINVLSHYTINCKDSLLAIKLDTLGANQFRWKNINDTLTKYSSLIGINRPGTYSVYVQGNNGCISQDTFLVNGDFVPPKLDITSGDLNCIYNKVTLTASAQIPGAIYVWDIYGQTVMDSVYTVDTAGLYSVKVISPNGCTSDSIVEVKLDTIVPHVEVLDGSLSCDSSNYTIRSSVSNEGGVYGWFGPNNFYSDDISPVAMDTGVYYLFYNAPNGCLTVDTFTIDDNPQHPMISLRPDTLTCRDSVLLLAAVSDMHIESYDWTGPGNFASLDIVAQVMQSGLYHLTVTGDNGCPTIDSVSIAIDTIHPVSDYISNDSIFCNHRKIKLTSVLSPIGENYSYQWTSADGKILSDPDLAYIWIDDIGTYALHTMNLKNGCVTSFEKLISEKPNPLKSIDADVTPAFCEGINNGSIQITGTPFSSGIMLYSIYLDVFSDNTFYNKLRPGNYIITGIDTTGCEVSDTFHITVADDLKLELGNDTIIRLGDPVMIQANLVPDSPALAEIIWTPNLTNCVDCLSFTDYPIQSTRYSVFITTAKGCKYSDSKMVAVQSENSVFVPNTFTPDENGMNDRVLVSISPAVNQILDFVIYDRWGNQVYGIHNVYDPPSNVETWDGQFLSRPASPGVFVYMLRYKMEDGKVFIKKGDLTLLR